MPVIALFAQGTHDEQFALSAGLHRDGVVVHREHSVEEDENADDGGRQQPTRVETQPGEVDGDFLAKIFPDVVQRLVFVPLAPGGPIMKEDLAHVELRWRSSFAGMFKRTLNTNQ